jgi:hypothetical protein
VTNTQVRVDEAQLQQRRREEALPALLARIEAALKASKEKEQ